jgi:hypothetical protein
MTDVWGQADGPYARSRPLILSIADYQKAVLFDGPRRQNPIPLSVLSWFVVQVHVFSLLVDCGVKLESDESILTHSTQVDPSCQGTHPVSQRNPDVTWQTTHKASPRRATACRAHHTTRRQSGRNNRKQQRGPKDSQEPVWLRNHSELSCWGHSMVQETRRQSTASGKVLRKQSRNAHKTQSIEKL